MKYHDLSHFSNFSNWKDSISSRLQYFFSDSKIARLILFGSVLTLFWQSYLLYILHSSFKNWQLPQIQKVQVVSEEFSDFKLVNNVETKHIFGEVVKPGGSLENALKTNLPLTLKGIMAYSDPKRGEAIIQDANGKEKAYVIGDRLPADSGLVTLEYVFKNKVYIKNNDVLEYILYPVLELQSGSNSDTSSKMHFNSRTRIAGVNRSRDNRSTRPIRPIRLISSVSSITPPPMQIQPIQPSPSEINELAVSQPDYVDDIEDDSEEFNTKVNKFDKKK
ncbi:MAG: hypothetical protein KBD64_04075 [Gammaproteobacteria bacterium]|nr:hypothetical protein [Gammaproteobacteria bacterium]